VPRLSRLAPDLGSSEHPMGKSQLSRRMDWWTRLGSLLGTSYCDLGDTARLRAVTSDPAHSFHRGGNGIVGDIKDVDFVLEAMYAIQTTHLPFRRRHWLASTVT
jgi:hypothetical protein